MISDTGGKHMDLVKIGKYIAGKRKDLGMTQKQLAEKLGMSDKSVSKWERGVCLPDVSVYSELCQILGISINEFLAGEDIVRENIAKKSEENIIGLATDSKQKQKRLKYIIGILLVTAAIVVLTVGIMIFRKNMPQNFIVPVDKDSIEMKTAEMLSGVDGAFMYKYTATNEFKTLYIHIWQYGEGKLVDRQRAGLSYEGMDSPPNGTIIIVPQFKDRTVKIIIADDESQGDMLIPILEDVPEGEHYGYGRAATEIQEKTDIVYDEQQPLLALIYDNDEARTFDFSYIVNDQLDALEMDDYVYYFSFEFRTE